MRPIAPENAGIGARSRPLRGGKPIVSGGDCLKVGGQVHGKKHLPQHLKVEKGVTLPWIK